MFNSSVRREAIETLKKAVAKHGEVREKTTLASERLFEQRRRASREVIERVETYVNFLANSPKEFDKTVADYRIASGRFDRHVERLEIEAAQTTKIGSATGTAGAMARGSPRLGRRPRWR